MLEKIDHIIMLKDFYAPLLTEKQQQVVNLYYENDWSLSEIADTMKITRQAVYDILKRAETALEDYENRLGLVDKFLFTRKQLNQVYKLLNSGADKTAIDEAVRILREISETV